MENRPVETYQVFSEDDVGQKLKPRRILHLTNSLDVAVKILSTDRYVQSKVSMRSVGSMQVLKDLAICRLTTDPKTMFGYEKASVLHDGNAER